MQRVQRLLLAVWCTAAASYCQIDRSVITTYAGTDWQFPGDGKLAREAPLSGDLDGVAVDAKGNYYFLDPGSRMVMKVGPDGILHVIGGNGLLAYTGDGGPATAAALGALLDIAVDAAGNVYFSEYSKIRKIDTNGIITTIAGGDDVGYSGDGGPATEAKFGYINVITLDNAGNLYVVDQTNHRIRRIVPGGNVTTIAGDGTTTPPADLDALVQWINAPNGIAVDGAGNVYFSDILGSVSVLRRISPDGKVSLFFVPVDRNGDFLYLFFGRMAADRAGNVYVNEAISSTVYKIDAGGTPSLVAGSGVGVDIRGFAGDGGPATKALLNNLIGGLALDPAGNLYIADAFNQRIRRVTADGIINTVAGSGRYRAADSIPATSAALYQPAVTHLDEAGNLYIAEPNANRVRKVAPNGIISAFAGTGDANFSGDQGPATRATFFRPQGIASDGKGNIYISDTFNGRVRKVAPDGAVTTVAGGGSTLGDKGPATSADVGFPGGLAFDSTGALYVADQLHDRIRKVTPDGVIDTFAGTGVRGFAGDGGRATAARLNGPTFLRFDRAGNLYVSDAGNERVRRIGTDGIITSVAGNGNRGFSPDGTLATAAALKSPQGLAFDRAGTLYIVDSGNYLVRVIDSAGKLRTVVGNGKPGFSGDGGLGSDATLSAPNDIAFDATGNLYIADYFNDRVRVVLVTPPQFQVFPSTLSYSVSVGGELTPAKNLFVSGSIPGIPFTLAGNRRWLQFDINNAVTPAAIQVSVDPSNLGEDLSDATLTVNAPSTSSGQQQTTVKIEVGLAAAGGIRVVSGPLSFALFQGSPATPQTVTLTNDSNVARSVSVATDKASPWLVVTPAFATLAPRAQLALQVTVAGSLAVGTYSGLLLVTDQRAGDTETLKVNVTVSAAPQSIFVTQSGITFTAVAGGAVTPPQTVGIVNLGRGAMPWTLTATDLAGRPAAWLAVSPASGSSDAAAKDVPQFTVTASHAGLAADAYYGQVQVRAPGADNSPQFVLVVLTVLPAGTDPGPVVQPAGLIFNAVAGGLSPSSQTVTVTNLSTQPATFTAGRSTQDGAPWFTHIPAAGTIAPGQFTRFVVQPLTPGLTPGVYRGFLTLKFAGNVARAINLVFVVAGAGSGTKRAGGRGAGTCSPGKLVPVFTSIGTESAVPAGWPQRLEVRVLDDCGSPMTSGAVTAQFSGNIPPLTMTSQKDGNWTGTWQSRNDPNPNLTIKVKAELAAQSLQGAAEITSTVTPNQDPPVLNASGVVNAASLTPDKPIAPGSVITISGARLASGSASVTTFPLPTQMAGTLVAMGGKALPLSEVAADHISAVVPFDMPVNTRLQLIVQRGNSAAVPETLTMAPVQPAIFAADNSGVGQGQIFKVTGTTLTLAARGAAASAGDTVQIQCTGLGAVDPPVAAGSAAPQSPLSRVTEPVTVTIGGVKAEVQFAVLQPGSSGYYAVVATVPAAAPAGDAVPVVITLAGQASPAVTMAVK